MTDASERAERFARRIGAIADPSVRVAYLRKTLSSWDPADLADVLSVVLSHAELRLHPYDALLLAMTTALADPALDEMRRRAARSAEGQGQGDVARLLGGTAEEVGARESFPVPDFGRGRPLTLGERKSLARRRDRALLGKVLRDPHPDVIRVVLDNPSITEDDIVRLCARRPIASEVLRTVAQHPRWFVRDAVRRALVLNPSCPEEIAIALVPHLRTQDARRVARSLEVAPAVREACKRTPTSTIH